MNACPVVVQKSSWSYLHSMSWYLCICKETDRNRPVHMERDLWAHDRIFTQCLDTLTRVNIPHADVVSWSLNLNLNLYRKIPRNSNPIVPLFVRSLCSIAERDIETMISQRGTLRQWSAVSSLNVFIRWKESYKKSPFLYGKGTDEKRPVYTKRDL